MLGDASEPRDLSTPALRAYAFRRKDGYVAVAWARAGGANALVVALGVDAATSDPESPLDMTNDGYREAGRILGGLGLPTVLVQEGGYDLTTIGPLVAETLAGVQEGMTRA